MEITIKHILRRLRHEFPNARIRCAGDRLYFISCQPSIRDRAIVLEQKAKLFNAHLQLGHVRDTSNWWKIV